MSSGEADAAEATRQMLAASPTLDAYVKCFVPGCDWRVHLPESRCFQHGGTRVPQYVDDSDGALIASRFTVTLPDGDCE